MTFTVRDLMLDVFPDDEGDFAEHRLYGAGQAPPKPKPQPKPECTDLTGGPPGIEASADLASLAVLREQLQQALHP
jgi:hypothetical protein